jgi:nucleoside-diphosphate-sugar epimerase
MKIFVSGGAGFIRGHLVCLLPKDEHVSRGMIF